MLGPFFQEQYGTARNDAGHSGVVLVLRIVLNRARSDGFGRVRRYSVPRMHLDTKNDAHEQLTHTGLAWSFSHCVLAYCRICSWSLRPLNWQLETFSTNRLALLAALLTVISGVFSRM